MITLKRKQIADVAVLQIKGEMTLEHAAELKLALLEFLTDAGELSIDCVKVERVDLSGLQLLCSVARSVSEQNRSITIAVDELPVFQQAFTNAGFPADWQQLLSADQSQEAAQC
jgi:ABC-type transporter Mla MlaB component